MQNQIGWTVYMLFLWIMMAFTCLIGLLGVGLVAWVIAMVVKSVFKTKEQVQPPPVIITPEIVDPEVSDRDIKNYD